MNYDAYVQAHCDYWERIGKINPYSDVNSLEATEGRKSAFPRLCEAVGASEANKILRVVKKSAECLTKEEFKGYDGVR